MLRCKVRTAAVTAAPRLDAQRREPICIGVLGSDPLRLIGLQAILQDELHFHTRLLGEGHDPQACQPDVVLIDAGAQSVTLVGETVGRVRSLLPEVPVVAMVRAGTSEALQHALEAGAQALLSETADVDEIRACMQSVLEGRSWLPREAPAVDATSAKTGDGPSKLSSRFTPKEREVLSWLTQGRSNREIASTMHIDEATVKAHLGRMLRKAKATNRVELTLRVLAERRV